MVVFHFMDPDDAQYDVEPVGAEGTGTRGSLSFDEIFMYARAKIECEEWLLDYQSGKKVPKILLIQGKKGCGKTYLAEKLIAKYGYHVMDLRVRDAPGKKDRDSAMSKKDVMDVFKNSLFFRNVQEYDGKASRQSVLYFDDVETMLQIGDNVIFNEILNILKACKRTDLKKEKKDAPVKRKGRAKKAVGSTEEKDYFIYNPMICTCNYTTDKKMAEFRKLCKVIDLGVPTREDLVRYIEYQAQVQGIRFPEAFFEEWIVYHESDLRKIQHGMEELGRLSYATEERVVAEVHLSYYYQMFGKVDLNCQLHEGIDMVFRGELSIGDSEIIYSSDPLLVPLMVHYNILEYMQMGKGSFREKIASYEEVMHGLCLYDSIHTSNYKVQGWDNLPESSAIFSTYLPNREIMKYPLASPGKFKLKFTNVLNKISQLEVNRAMIGRAYGALNRFICDEDELMYLIEIFLNMLKVERSPVEEGVVGEGGEEDGEAEVEGEEVEVEGKRVVGLKRSLLKKLDAGLTLERSEYREIIQWLNEFNIDVSSLELILKIEKLNLFQNKNPKRFTARMREELMMFVTATSYGDGED